VKKLVIDQNTARAQSLRKQSTVDTLTENFSRAMRSRSPDCESERLRYRNEDRLSGNRAMSLPTTPTRPNVDSRRQQELIARLDFLGNLK